MDQRDPEAAGAAGAPSPASDAPAHDVSGASEATSEPEPAPAPPAEPVVAAEPPIAVHGDSEAHQIAFGDPAPEMAAHVTPAAPTDTAASHEAPSAETTTAEMPAAETATTEVPAAETTLGAMPPETVPVAEAATTELSASEVATADASAKTSTAAADGTTSEPAATEVVLADAPATDVVTAAETVTTDAPPNETATAEAPAAETTTGEATATDGAPQPAAVDPRRARAQQAWERVVAAHAAGEHVTGNVTAAVKGGLLVDVGGIRGFLPASQVRVTIGTALDTLVKTKLPLKILDVDAGRRRIVVSQRRAVDEERRAKRGELLRSLEVGQIRDAVVARLTDFGAFVDLGGIDGLIPMRELAFERVEKTSDVLNVGDTVSVQVLRIEEGGKKIALSRKNALPDPWRDHAALLRSGTTIEGKVVGKDPQLIVEIAPGVTGAVRRDDVEPNDYEIGEAIEVMVRSVDRMRRRISLTTMHAAAAAAAMPQTSSMTTTSGFAPLGVELAQRGKK
ncbi:MAG TPA: S1 RNA-binding domain-containing protein [Candidatus Elarobacter sp.]|nr:S1 RNA-binding domain-containing protein [Candidatus Elarobacter sp.]